MNIRITLPAADRLRTLELSGRLGWAMFQLVKAGPHGVSPLECPALRWSGYVYGLRKLGVPIDTAMEAHGGPYGGQHARYRLACDASVSLIKPEDAR